MWTENIITVAASPDAAPGPRFKLLRLGPGREALSY